MTQDRPPDTPATGSPAPQETRSTPEDEPVVTGALFLSMVMLMLIAGAWVVMFFTLLER